MDDAPHHPPDPEPDPEPLRTLYRDTVATLRAILPKPREDTPEAWAHRDRLALVALSALLPTTPMEAEYAALHIATAAHARDCLRSVTQHAANPRLARSFHAQAASLAREARAYLNVLLRAQAARRKCQANGAARDSAAVTEETVLRQLTQALNRLPPWRPQAPAPQAEPSAPARQPEPPKQPDPPRQPDRRLGNVITLADYHPSRTIH